MIKGLGGLPTAWRHSNGTANRSTTHVCRALLSAEADRQRVPLPLSVEELRRDAQLARLSGLCYVRTSDELSQRLQHAGMQLVAQGRSWCTSWYVADRIPGAERHAGGASAGAARPTAPLPERLICSRGVAWSHPDVDSMRVWQGLVRAWPSPFLPDRTRPRGALVAHTGVAEMATELWQDVGPLIAQAPGSVTLAGHSLGGSLSLLLACMATLELGLPGSQLSCATFGSPPVLSLAHGLDEGGRLLGALGMGPASVRNYVLADDPVPRALLSADPAFEALKSSPLAAGLLQLRERLLGEGAVLSPTRFLYHAVGAVLLLRWSQEGGYSLRLVGSNLADELRMDVGALRSQPMRLVQAVMDHHHASYSQAITASAAQLMHSAAGAQTAGS